MSTLFGWLLRAVPGLGALSGFFNPWVIVSIMSAFVAGVGYEVWQQGKREAARDAVIEGVEKLQAYKVAAKAAEDKRAKEASDAETIARNADLQRQYDHDVGAAGVRAARLEAGGRGSGVPGVPPAAGGGYAEGERICFEGNQLARGMGAADGLLRKGLADSLGRLQQEARGILQRGDREAVIAGVCSRWAVGRYLERKLP